MWNSNASSNASPKGLTVDAWNFSLLQRRRQALPRSRRTKMHGGVRQGSAAPGAWNLLKHRNFLRAVSPQFSGILAQLSSLTSVHTRALVMPLYTHLHASSRAPHTSRVFPLALAAPLTSLRTSPAFVRPIFSPHTPIAFAVVRSLASHLRRLKLSSLILRVLPNEHQEA